MRYCEACFIGWHEGAAECWQCGHDTSITKAEGQAILENIAVPPFDNGGVLPAGVVCSPETLSPSRRLTPAQEASFARAVELVARWRGRDCRTVHLPEDDA